MAWAHVQSKSNFVDAVTTITVTLTSTPATGNKIVCVASANRGAGAPTFTGVADGNSNALTAWGTAGLDSAAGAGVRSNVYFYDVPATPSSAFTLTISPATGCALLVMEFSGLLAGNTTACVDGTPGSLASTANPTGSPTYSSSALNELLITTWSDYGGDLAFSINTAGYTTDPNNTAHNAIATAAAGYKNTANGAEAGSWTQSVGDHAVVLLGAFKLASGGTNHPQTAAATATSTAALVRQIGKTLAGSSTSSATATAVKVKLLSALAAATSTPALVRQIGRKIASSSLSASDINMVITMHLSGATVAAAATATALKVRLLNALASVVPTSGLARQVGKLVAGTPASTAGIARGVSRTVTAAPVSAVIVVRQVGKKIVASVASSGTAGVIKVRLVAVAAAAVSTAAVVRQTAKTVLTSPTSAVALGRQIARTVTVPAVTAATALKAAAKTILAPVTAAATAIASRGGLSVTVTATATSAVSLVRQIAKTVAASPLSVIALRRAISKAVTSFASAAGQLFLPGQLVTPGTVTCATGVYATVTIGSPTVSEYTAGQVIPFTATFAVDGVPTDPTTVAFLYAIAPPASPSGATITLTYTGASVPAVGVVAKTGVGAYKVLLDSTALPGTWTHEWKSTGVAQTVGPEPPANTVTVEPAAL